MTAPDPIDAAVRRAAEAFRLAAPELDPRSPAGYGPWRAALEAAGLPAALARVAELEAERDGLKNSILDIDAHATPYGVRPEDPDGNPAAYLVTVGALHRAIGKVGHTAAPYHVVLARMVSAEAAVERVRTLSAEFDDEWQQLERDPNRGMDTMGRADGLREASERLDRTLDAAGTPDEVPTTGPQVPTSARQDVGTPASAPADDDPAVLAVLAVWDRKGDFQDDPDSAPVMLQYARDAVAAVRAAGAPATPEPPQ